MQGRRKRTSWPAMFAGAVAFHLLVVGVYLGLRAGFPWLFETHLPPGKGVTRDARPIDIDFLPTARGTGAAVKPAEEEVLTEQLKQKVEEERKKEEAAAGPTVEIAK